MSSPISLFLTVFSGPVGEATLFKVDMDTQAMMSMVKKRIVINATPHMTNFLAASPGDILLFPLPPFFFPSELGDASVSIVVFR